MNFETYLLNELYAIANELGFNNKIRVAEYRSFQMPEDKTDILFVIRYITGNYVGDIKTQPVQLFAYSELDDIDSVYMILDSFSKKHNNYQTTVDGTFAKFNFETPVSMRNFIQSETGYRASVYVYGSYISCDNVSDIKALLWDDQDIKYLSATLGYTAVLNTTKISGKELSESVKQEAGLTLSLSLMSTTSDFCKKVEDIMYGTEKGNYAFNFTLINNDDTQRELTMRLETSMKPSSKTEAPTLQLTFRR